MIVGSASVSVNRVGLDASVTGSITATQEDLSVTGAGNLVLVITTGNLVIGAGTPSTAGIIVGSGNVVIQTLDSAGDLSVDGDITNAGGSVTVLAGQSATFAAGADILTSGTGNVEVRAASGDLLMPLSVITTGSGSVLLRAANVLQPGVIDTSGNVSISTNPGGVVQFIDAADRQGDVTVVADRIDILAPLGSVGSALLIAPLASATPVDIIVGGVDNGTALHLSLDEVNLIQDGFTQITLGNAQANQSVVIQGKNGANAAAPVIFKDPLILDLGGAGSRLAISGQLQGDSLTVLGTAGGLTSALVGANISMGHDVTINGLLRVDSASSITAGTSGAGNLVITGNISGLTGVVDTQETLNLRANGGNVDIRGSIADIDGLTISSAINVTFAETVSVTGNLLIDATGIVSFNKALTLTAAGSLTIRGATGVVFGNGVVVQVSGDVTLDAQSLALLGGANSISTTGGVLTITSATASSNVMLGADVDVAGTVGALNLTAREIVALGNGFTKVVIGESGIGTVTLAGNSDFTSLTGTPLQFQGNNITVSAGIAGSTVQMPNDVTLQASGNITLNSGMNTAGLNKISLVSGGNITMAAGTRVDSRGGNIQVSALGNLALATINARSADLIQSGVVDIRSESGTISDANLDSTADIFARAINLYGYGPSTVSGGDVLEVVADLVRVLVPQGLVVRDSGTDGRAYFNVMNSGNLYQELVVIGSVTRVTEDPAGLLKKDDAALIAAGIPANSRLLRSPVSSLYLSSLTGSAQSMPDIAANLTVSSYLSAASAKDALTSSISISTLSGKGDNAEASLLLDPAYGVADHLQQFYILGTPGEQPLVSGLSTFSQDTFEYWVDTLSL